MTRYYYTDHIASLWMEKRHGMKFVDKRGNPIFQNGAHIDGTYKIYIHPDSLHLLEPNIGDVCRTNTKLETGFDDVILIESKHELAEYNDVDGFKIIQRNGQAFHWPESEEA